MSNVDASFCKVDNDVYPRAIVDRAWSYNFESNLNFSNESKTYWTNKYWCGFLYTN